MKEKKKRKIVFAITSFIHYSRNFLILEELRKQKNVELHIVLGGIVLSDKYTSSNFNVRKILEADGYENLHEAYFNMDGDSAVIKAKTVGLGMLEFSSVFVNIKPDIVLVRGDRFEVLAAVIAAAYMNIPVAHIEGGDISGTLDESVRHAITKLSHIHFTTNDQSRKRVLRMGENEDFVFNFGSPDIEVVREMEKTGFDLKGIDFENFGSGTEFDASEDFVMVMYHPVSTELKSLSENTKKLLEAVHRLKMQAIWFWPNFDAGAEYISHELRKFKNDVSDHKIKFMRYLPPKQFLSLLVHSKCLIGNSSAGIKECSYLGIPVVNIGTRQHDRLHAENVINCGNDTREIGVAIRKQIKAGRYPSSHLYVSDDTSKKIATVLAGIELHTQKVFYE